MATSRTQVFTARSQSYPATSRRYPTAPPPRPTRGATGPSPSLAPTLRFLALLLLLTPLLGGVSVLLTPAAPPPPEVVTQVVEVPRTIYVAVPVPTLIVVEVPVAAEPPANAEAAIAAAPAAAEAAPDAAGPAPSEETDLALQAEPVAPSAPIAPPVAVARAQPVPAVRIVAPPVAEEPLAAEPGEAADAPLVALAEAPADEPGEAAAAPDENRAPALAARQAVSDFYAFTEQNWSVQGYSSAAEMREALGNRTTGWLKQTEALAASADVPAQETTEESPLVLADQVSAPADEPSDKLAQEPGSEPAVGAPDEPLAEAGGEPEAATGDDVGEVAQVPDEVAAEPGESEDQTATSHPPVVSARQAVSDFYAFTERSWSVQGYSSAAEMREALGNKTTGWLEQTEALANSEDTSPDEVEE